MADDKRKTKFDFLCSKGLTLLLALGLIIPGVVSAATLSQGNLLTNVLLSSGQTILAAPEDHVFTQTNNAPTPGFSILDSANQAFYYNSDDSGQSTVTVQSLVFSGDPIEMGIPGEVGSLTIEAGNAIPDITTDRTYSRPVVFTQLITGLAAFGIAIVPNAPLMAGNTFSFSVENTPGLGGLNLEGATVNYFIAEEGWHRLADGRLLLISSVELRDEDYAGLSFDLGADFTNAVTVAQLQRPALILNSDGSVTPKTGYQGVMLTGGQGDFNSLTMRFMADADYEAETTVRNFGARVGFMVLGNANVYDNWPMVYRQNYSSSNADSVFGEGYFKNYRHSAAASPMFNKTACGDDADLDGYCFFLSPPADLPSRQSKFDLPRLPYMDEKFQPLTLNRNFHGDFYDYDWWWDIGTDRKRHSAWEAEVEAAAEQPNNYRKYELGECSDANDCPIEGALSQGLPKYDSDRWWDLYGFANTRMEFGHWYNLRNYDACVEDGVNSACTDLTPIDLYGSPSIDWETQTVDDNNWRVDAADILLESQSSAQAVFTELDASYIDGKKFFDVLTPGINASLRLAEYLNFDLPDDINWLQCNVRLPTSGYPGPMDVFHRLQYFANTYADQLQLAPWQVMGSKIWIKATETKDLNGYTYSDSYYYGMYIPVPANDDSWQAIDWGDGTDHTSCFIPTNGRLASGLARVYEYDYVPTFDHIVKPVIDKLGNYVAPGVGGVFANYPFSGNESNLRWVRSSEQNHATATIVASGQAGYVASADDENNYLSFCLDNSDGKTICAEDWVRVKASPYINSIQLFPINAYAFIGGELQATWWTSSPSGDPASATKTWWVVNNSIDTDATPHPTRPRTMVYSTAGMEPSWVQFCVQPATEYVTGETVCTEKVFVDYDSDGDGTKDSVDLDDDNDNTRDVWDRFPLDPNEAYDHDNDGIGDNADTDDDNDGLPDSEEGANNLADYEYCATNLSTVTDPFNPNSDGDDLLDGEDPYPCFAGEWLDVDGDGIHDKDDADNDNDGVDDIYDAKRLEPCLSAHITVTNANDSGPGSLRQALSDLCAHDPDSPLDNGIIDFDGPYTIHLQSPLQPYGGATIDGNHQVTISGDSNGDGNADVALFNYDLPDYLRMTQNLQLRNITLSHGKSVDDRGSVVNLNSTRHLFFDRVLLSHNQTPVVAMQYGQVYLENSIVAHNSGSEAAFYSGGGYIGITHSTFVNNVGGAIGVGSIEVNGRIQNSLFLNGESGSASCKLVNAEGEGNWFETEDICGAAGTGVVILADAANDDYRPVPGSASIDVGTILEGSNSDYAGNARMQNDIADAGALEYDPNGDFDGDGVTDNNDAFPSDKTESVDSDGDGVGDNADAFPNDSTETVDSDNDGVGDNSDAFPHDSSETADNDGDGVGNNSDAFPNDASEIVDSDGDGVGDNKDDFPHDASETKDTDGDGTGDNADAFPLDATESKDSDSDGVGDNADAFPHDPTETADSDGDGIGNNADAFANDASENKDSDGDGVGDNEDAFPTNATESVDSDGDSVGDNADAFPHDPTETADTDGDGVGNNADAFDDDPTESSDADGDGVGDNSDEFPNDPTETVDSDKDGVGDNADAFPNDKTEQYDQDGDGVGDNADAFDDDPNESADSDGDGVGDNADAFPNDPSKSAQAVAENGGDTNISVSSNSWFTFLLFPLLALFRRKR